MIKDRQGIRLCGNWYKGNLHSHTVNSDGKLTPKESVRLFKENGYSFLCLSEHDLYTDYRKEFNSEDFIILPGLEASVVLYEERGSERRLKVHHIHGILGTEKMQRQAEKPLFKHMEYFHPRIYYGEWEGQQAAQELSDELRKRGCITTYNHPIWSRVDAEDFTQTEGLYGLEIFNYGTVNESGTGYDTTYWDVMLRQGRYIHGFASDDNHNEGLFDDACGGYIVVQAEALENDLIIEAMMSGNYYSSSGPEIYDWGIRDGKAFVKCSEVNRVNFICGNEINAGGTVMCNHIEDTMTQAGLELKGTETYLRIECIDKYGRTAWTNPMMLGE